ncbi:MAG: CheR family methyltransferase [Rhodocyclaceae bacterium]|nr:CheR family methyltransferase [Rhodocyclaceae bacterium]
MTTPAHEPPDSGNKHGDSLDPAGEEALCRLITERTGIVLHDHQLRGLRDTVAQACAHFGYAGAAAYRQALTEKAAFSPELEFLVAQITVGESYFFRDAAQMDLLRDTLLPELIARKRLAGDRAIRVWSAGCSNGQEIYSIAILLHELLPDIDRWALHLLATDINTDVLAAALRGRYRDWSLRATPAPIATKYFKPVGSEHELDGAIRKRVKFSYLNLSEDAFPSLITETHALDLILCRNVLIYIEGKAARQIVHRFAQSLLPEGLLLLGTSDHVEWPADALQRIQLGDAAFLRKLPAPAPEAVAAPSCETAAQRPAAISTDAVAEALNLLGTGLAAPARGAGAEPTDLARVVELLRAERWREALLAVDQAGSATGTSAGLLQARAKALANLGDLEAALQACEQSLALNPTDKHTYLIQGMALMEHGQAQQAEAALRKAMFLDHAFAEAHHQLGHLLLRLGRRAAGLKSLRNALQLAEQSDPQRPIHNAPGMNHGRFAEILRHEIGIHAAAIPATRRQHGQAAAAPARTTT